MRSLFLVCFALFLAATQGVAQRVTTPVQADFYWEQLLWLSEKDSTIHFGANPVRMSESDYQDYSDAIHAKFAFRKRSSWLGRKWYNEHFLVFKGEDYTVRIDPLIHLRGGRDLNDTLGNLSTNTRGIQVQGAVGKKVSFYTSFYETQSFFPQYIRDQVRSTNSRMIMGHGIAKPFKQGGYDYGIATGFVLFEATRVLEFQFGHDKMFIGHGYRSLLLSDNAFNYPALQTRLKLFKGKLIYNTSLAWLLEARRVPRFSNAEALYVRRQANFNYLSFKPNKYFEIGLFEGVMWQRWDDSLATLAQNPLFFNPLPFINSFVSTSDSLNTGYLGVNAAFNPTSKTSVYGQILLNKEEITGHQFGFRWMEPLKIKGLFTQIEYNQTQNNAYLPVGKGLEWTHFNQNLALPLGNNQTEWMFHSRYQWSRLFASGRYFLQNQNGTKVNILTAECGYLINPLTNLNLFAGITNRVVEQGNNTQWIYLGIRSSILNQYSDF